MAGVASAAIVSGELIIGLDDGQIIRAGYIQGPQGLKGDRGPMGSTGPAGKDGNTLLHGLGTPQFDDGLDGDFFYSTDQVAIYGPKTGGQWGKPVYLRPQDNKSFTLPTGMKSQGSSSAGRAFAASMGGPGGGTGLPAPTNDGLDLITGHGKPLAAAVSSVIASDTKGDAMHVIVKADSANGSWYGEIIVSHFGAITDHTVAWEVPMGAAPPRLTFTTAWNVDHIELSVTSNQNLLNIRGKVIYV